MNLSDLKEKALQTADRVRYQAMDLGRKALYKGQSAMKWCVENPEKFGAIVGSLAVANKLARNVRKNIVAEHEIYDKKRRIYDQSLKGYVYTKRPLSSRDIQRINEEKRRTGKRYVEILAEMDLLKR